jgi:ABC-type cobalt transport system substrate-binding protein
MISVHAEAQIESNHSMHANHYTNDLIPHYRLWFGSIWALGMHANHYTNDVIPHYSLWFDSIWALGKNCTQKFTSDKRH